MRSSPARWLGGSVRCCELCAPKRSHVLKTRRSNHSSVSGEKRMSFRETRERNGPYWHGCSRKETTAQLPIDAD